MKIFATVVFAAFFILGPQALAEDTAAEEGCAKIATVYDEIICVADIALDQKTHENVEAYARKTRQKPEKALHNIQKSTLLALIWEKALIHDFGKDAITPTKKEKDAYLSAMRRANREQYNYDRKLSALIKKQMAAHDYAPEEFQKLNRLGMEKQQAVSMYEMRGKAPGSMKSKISKGEHEVAEAMTKSWKVNSLLYKAYGGRIIYQQNGLEPIDAYKTFLEDIQQKNVTVIHDKNFRDVFDDMEDYIDKDHTEIPAGSPEIRAYFSSPTWLYDSGVSEEAYEAVKDRILNLPYRSEPEE